MGVEAPSRIKCFFGLPNKTQKEKTMRQFVKHPIFGDIIYDENAFTGKKSLSVGGIDAEIIPNSKEEYVVGERRVTLKGSFLTGVSLFIDDETIEIAPKLKWYEIALAVIPLAFLVTWGNSAELCAIFPVVGGAIGGALGGVGGVLSLLLMKKSASPLVKVLIGLGIAAATILAAFGIAVGILQLLA